MQLKMKSLKKIEFNAKIKNIEDKIPNISNLANKTNINTKISQIKNEIPSISGLATHSALASVENKVPHSSNLVKKTDQNANVTAIEKKITDLNHDKYITTTEFNKLATDAFNARPLQANLVKNINFDNKLSDLNRKIVSNKTRHIHRVKNYFHEDGNQNDYISQPISKYLKVAYVNDIIFYHGSLED